MDGANKFQRNSWKVKVTQEYDVYLYFHEGINLENDEDVYSMLMDEAVNSAFEEDGLAGKNHEDTETHNGYLSYTITYEPTVNVTYHYDDMPQVIKLALKEKGL